ncbi:L-aspartate oxidase [Fusobacterium polymorphum]|uniref:L-aspartate oxidase n=1 Tax=Fusobacterium nucleatum subsp. polymorphum TaxID=76857 RepID=UPI0030CB8830
MKVENSDVVIVGSGVAGLICALSLDKNFKVILITKKKLKDSNSYLAQGGVSVCRGKEDREEYIEDTLIAGHYKNNKEAVEILVDESEEAIKTLIENGVKFTGDEKGPFYTREGGHSKFRILYCEDQTGKYIMESLIEKLLERDNIKIIEDCEFLDIIEKENTCLGILAKKEEKFAIKSKFTVLATGGLGGIYKNTTNFSHIKGDGIAIAIRHNIELKDISYIQIHPTTFYTKENERKFLISESVRGEGAVLLNQKLERFTDELKPRDKVTKAILEEMKKDKSEYEWLDFSTINLDIKERFPNIYNHLMKNGIDPLKDKVPITPAQHYTMGGIKVDTNSKTSMTNLYAIGEVACTGVHGQNRLASNSLLESVVFAKRASQSIIDENNISVYNNITDDIFKNIVDKIIITNEKENKNIIMQRIKEDEFEKNR